MKFKVGKKNGFVLGIVAIIFFFFGGNFLGKKIQEKKDQMEIQKSTIEKEKTTGKILDVPHP